TQEFADEVIARLGQKPQIFASKHYVTEDEVKTWAYEPIISEKKLVGVDVFVDNSKNTAEEIAELINDHVREPHLKLQVITNR
ncbi:hypothetical protein ACSLVQ_29700, partial [Klebsiella pneumoniae]|uniref:hypothetical protein n=1 Tax=Klebsiella pneumoniae TaxID=573 RepID=UPI003EE2E467